MGAVAARVPHLATVLCVEYGSGNAPRQAVPGAVVAELPRSGESVMVQDLLRAARMHPVAHDPRGGRVAFLALFVGFDDGVLALARRPELTSMPILFARVPADDPGGITAAVEGARKELITTPGFSVPVRAGHIADAAEEPRPAPLTATQHPAPVTPPVADDGSIFSRLAAGAAVMARGLERLRRDPAAVPAPAYPGEEAGLLAIVTVEGPEANRATRALQRRLVAELRRELADQGRVPWLSGCFRAGEGLQRSGATRPLADLNLWGLGSRHAGEIDLSAVSAELLADIVVDRQTMVRRGWSPAWVASLFVAPGMPHLGVRRNPYFERLAGTVDQVLWIGTHVETVPRPLQVEGVGVLPLRPDSGREAGHLLLGASGLRAVGGPAAAVRPPEAAPQEAQPTTG